MLVPAPAIAAKADPVVKDCAEDGKLDRRYTQEEYRRALRNIPTDVDEYTDCRDVIRRAQLGDAGDTGGAGGPGGGGIPGAGSAAEQDALLAGASPAERKAIEAARRGDGAPIRLGDQTVTPGRGSFTSEDVRHDLPAPLLITLLLLAVGALAAGGRALHVRGRLPLPDLDRFRVLSRRQG